jgi:hypothetical protein
VKLEASATQAIALANFYTGDSAVPSTGAGIIPIFYARPWMADLANQDAPAYGMAGIDSFTIEVTFTGSVTITTATLTNLTITGEPLGDHVVLLPLSRSFGSTGIEDVVDIPRNPSFQLMALHIQTTTSNFASSSAFELLADGSRVLFADTLVNLNQRYLSQGVKRAVQTGFAHLDFCYRNRMIDALPLSMGDLRLRLNWGSAPSGYTILMEQKRVQPAKGVAA